MKLQKMSINECTVPADNACCISSLLEAESIFATQQIKYKQIRLMHLRSSLNEERLRWCAMLSRNDINHHFPLFYETMPMRGIPLTGKTIEPGEYISHNHSYYILCRDDIYKQVIRRITVFSSYEQIAAIYAAKQLEKQSNSPQDNELPDFHLVKISDVQTPNKTLCVFWFMQKTYLQPFFPVFEEDACLLREKDRNSLNWELLEENDVFEHNGQRYVVCCDEDNCPYIAKSHLQIAVRH